jgi:L-ascorbate metabolism protein UlaG (beta-lactamase superfamily)
MKDFKELFKGVKHINHASIRIEDSKVIYFDPFSIEGEPHDADIIFVTHIHSDHFDVQSIKKIMKPDAVLVLPVDCVKKAEEVGITSIAEVVPNKEYELEGIRFNTIPAYNTNKDFHKKDSNWVGYVVNINGANYYVAGDTDVIPEMNCIKADVVFLPVGGKYTMTAREAAGAANIIKPAFAVPIHFGGIVGTNDDAKEFINYLDKGIEGRILKEKLI